ncbi:MAG: Ppx/GppA phosphatase family protein [Mariprofundaceae bacterium]|nr:Ppx/GppA phosphatase family protein [Mariprofundaceae bacterium]
MSTITPNKAFAAIDIGSNTFRLLIAEPRDDSTRVPWRTMAYTHRIIRLGEGLHQSGKLCDAAMQRALHAFHAFANILQQHGVKNSQLFAVATAAMREAENGTAFCQLVARETGIHIQIIDGQQEAHHSLVGSCAVLNKTICQDFLLFDIGGGSTEFIRARNQQNQDAISQKLGVVRLVERFLHSDPPTQHDYAAIKLLCHKHLDDVEEYWQKSNGTSQPPKYLVGTAGTVTTLAAIDLSLSSYDADIINNHGISRKRFFILRDQLLAMTLKERQAIAAIESGRADLMIAGLAIIESIFERWEYTCMTTVDAGLLEGAWLNISALSNSNRN